MKIALVILHADAARGGAERYTIDLATALAHAGHDVSILATTFRDIPESVKQVILPARGALRSRRYVRMLDSLDEHLSHQPFDIVHAMLPVRQCDVYHPHAGLAVAALEGSQKKLAAIFNPRRITYAVVERLLLKTPKPPVVLCLSDYVKRSIVKHYPLDDAHVPILFNAVDLHRFEVGQRPAHAGVNALLIAQDFERKGLAQTIEALALVDDRSLHLTVVGKQDAEQYRQQAAARGVADQVTFIGPTTDTRPFYRNADFFVLPTKYDPCSLVVLEALAMGVPVISTKFNGACEIMSDGMHGFVLDDPHDVKTLAAKISQLLNPALRAKMSAACLALRPKLAYETHLSTLLNIYSTITSRNVRTNAH